MHAIETTLPADPLWIARQLWAEQGPVLLWSADGGGPNGSSPSYVACWPTEEREGLDPEPSLPCCEDLPRSEDDAVPDARSVLRASVPRWIGILPYEAERARMERPKYRGAEMREAPHHTSSRWWRYPAVVRIDHRVQIVGDDAAQVARLREHLERRCVHAPDAARTQHGLARLIPRTNPAELTAHVERVAKARELIRQGEIYQVNLARRITLDVEGDTLALLTVMARRAPAAYCAALELAGVVSTSPELFLTTTPDGSAHTVPIKGTRPRGSDPASDARLRRELDLDEKEHAELSMIIDVERNDLGKVSRTGSVVAQTPRVVRHATLFHREAVVASRLRHDVTRSELLQSMLPSGSVTGAPKVRAMELIATLEAERRGLYTGALGYLTHAGTLHLSMAIRTLTVQNNVGHYFTGGGIVLDSDPERELQETAWKALQLEA